MDYNTEAGLELHVRTECKDFVILQVQFLDITISTYIFHDSGETMDNFTCISTNWCHCMGLEFVASMLNFTSDYHPLRFFFSILMS